MKICILTQALHSNYGGLLQAYALQRVLLDMGHDVVTDRNGAKSKTKTFWWRITHFGYHFIKRYILQDKRYDPFLFLFTSVAKRKEIKARKQIAVHTTRFIANNIRTVDFFEGRCSARSEIIDRYDALVVGSDQVWRAIFSQVDTYCLDFAVGRDIKKIAYSASFGLDSMCEFTPALVKRCAAAAKHFDAVSVREDSGVDLCRENFGVEAVHLLDPTLLLDKEDYLSLIEDQDKAPQSNVMMCYVLDKSDEKNAIIKAISQKLDLSLLDIMPPKLNEEQDISKCIYPSVSAWIAGFRDAEFVITDSFHGTVFAIIFNKPFIAIANQGRGLTRFTSLLKIFDLEHRLINSTDIITNNLLQNIDFETVNSVKNKLQIRSLNFLTNALSD